MYIYNTTQSNHLMLLRIYKELVFQRMDESAVPQSCKANPKFAANTVWVVRNSYGTATICMVKGRSCIFSKSQFPTLRFWREKFSLHNSGCPQCCSVIIPGTGETKRELQNISVSLNLFLFRISNTTGQPIKMGGFLIHIWS